MAADLLSEAKNNSANVIRSKTRSIVFQVRRLNGSRMYDKAKTACATGG